MRFLGELSTYSVKEAQYMTFASTRTRQTFLSTILCCTPIARFRYPASNIHQPHLPKQINFPLNYEPRLLDLVCTPRNKSRSFRGTRHWYKDIGQNEQWYFARWSFLWFEFGRNIFLLLLYLNSRARLGPRACALNSTC
jgi:hypothetical protein